MRDVTDFPVIASAAKQSPLGVRTVMEISAWLQETRIAFGITFTVMAGTGTAMTITAGFILFTVPRLPLTHALRDDDRCFSVRVRYANILATGI